MDAVWCDVIHSYNERCMYFPAHPGGIWMDGMIVVEHIILFVAWIYFRHVIECCHEYLIIPIAIFFYSINHFHMYVLILYPAYESERCVLSVTYILPAN